MGAATIWDLLVGTGTALTLTIIVMIALALNALALFYLSSAVLVLERFARRVRRVRWVFVFAVLVVAVTGSLSLEQVARLEIGPSAPSPLVSSSLIFGGWALITSVSILLCWAGLRWLSPARLGTLSLLGLGGAVSLWIGAAGRLEFALVPALAVAVAASVVGLRRRLGGKGSPTRSIGTGERQLRWLAAALLPGPLLAAALPEPSVGLHQAGLAVLQTIALLIVFGMLPLAAAGLVEMRRSAEWFLAVRYLTARRRQVYISAITLLCVGGIAAGVWLIVTVLSVMNGFERAWREQIVGDVAHFTVHSGRRISDYQGVMDIASSVPGVEDVSPYLDAEGMVRSADGRLFAVRLRGIDPATADQVTGISGRLVDGSLDALSGRSPDAPPGIVIGEPLAEKLGARPGTELVLISPLGGPPTPLGPAPRLKRFRVVGTFRSQLYQFGEVYTYVNLPDVQDFLRAGDVVDGIEVRTADLYTSRRVAGRVRASLGSSYYTRDWKDQFPVFFAALRDNRSMMTLLLGMIMVVAAFMIVATLMMMIMEKSSDIAILKAMGADDATIERVFAIEGALIGMAGTTVGVVAGLVVTSRLEWIQTTIEAITGVDTLPQSIYQLSTLPADHDPVQIFGIAAMAMVLALGATLVPARQGARFDPVEGLRSE